MAGKDRARCLTGPFPHPPRENRAYGFHHTTAHARRTAVGSSFAGFSRCIPPIAIRLVTLLRRPPDSGAFPCTRLSRAPQVGRYSHEYYHRSATSHTPGFGPYLALFPTGRFPFRGLFRLGLWRIRPGSHRAYSPLSLASRARLPVSPMMDSPTWFRWWFAAHPNRALRLPAWEEVCPGRLLSTFQHAHVMHAVDTLLHNVESGQAAVLSGVVEQGVIFPKDETHFRCIHHATSQSSLPSWLHTFASAGLSGRCCSPSTASYLADSQGLTGYLVYPAGLPIQRDPSSIPSYSFHGAHLDITTAHSGWCSWGTVVSQGCSSCQMYAAAACVPSPFQWVSKG